MSPGSLPRTSTTRSASRVLHPLVKILPVRVLNAEGGGIWHRTWPRASSGPPTTAACVINLSLGGGKRRAETHRAIEYTNSKGAIVIAAGGQRRSDRQHADLPGRVFPMWSRVAAVDSSGRHAAFGNTGRYLDVSAPGVGIVSTWGSSPTAYADASGTSMAARTCLAEAALIIATNPRVSVARVTQLLGTARDASRTPSDLRPRAHQPARHGAGRSSRAPLPHQPRKRQNGAQSAGRRDTQFDSNRDRFPIQWERSVGPATDSEVGANGPRTKRAPCCACCAAGTLIFGVVGLALPASADSGSSYQQSGGSDRGHNHDQDHNQNHDQDHGRHRHGQSGFFVSPQGSSSGSGQSCSSANFSTIGAAVAAAPAGGTVVVCPGTYQEDVLVNKQLNLMGRRSDHRRHRTREHDPGCRLVPVASTDSQLRTRTAKVCSSGSTALH